MQAYDIEFCIRLAKAVALQFGPNCEVVVHDLRANDPEHSIVAIENGHVSGRRIGDGPFHVVLEALKSDTHVLQDRLAYLAKTEDGKILKSSTIYLRNDDGEVIGIFAINYDITMMVSMENALHAFTAPIETSAPEQTPVARNVTDLLDELIEQSVSLVGKPVALMTKDDKVKAIRFLNDSGVFLITKSGQKACTYFGISKYTLYSYIDEAKTAAKAAHACVPHAGR